jgi:hypothetical protein
MGMELVSLETEEENTCVKKLLKDAGKYYATHRIEYCIDNHEIEFRKTVRGCLAFTEHVWHA